MRCNEWYFGYKAHVDVDRDSGLVHTVKVTSASVHDVSVVADLLIGEEKLSTVTAATLVPRIHHHQASGNPLEEVF